MKRIILFMALALWALFGCQERMTDKDVVLDSKVKSEAKTVKIDTVGFFDEFPYAKYFFVYKDTILIVNNRKYTDVYFIEFYNLKQKQLLRQFFRLGNGPDEMLFVNSIFDGNILTVNDLMKNQVAFVNIDSVLNNPQYSPRIIRHYFDTSIAVRYKEGQLLMENPNCFKSRELGIDQKAPRFIVTADNQPYVEDKEYLYQTWNVASSGKIITNLSKDRVMYADNNTPCLQIYNNDLELIKQIHGPDKLPIKYAIKEDNGIVFNGPIPLTYCSFCTTAEFVYLNYLGDTFRGSEYHLPAWIFKFDWDGNLIESYSVGQHIYTISLSADEKNIYATAVDDDEELFLIKITL